MLFSDHVYEKVAFAAFQDELRKLELEEALEKTASADFMEALYDDFLNQYGEGFVKTASDEDLEEAIKIAFINQLVQRFPVLGMNVGDAAKKAVGAVGSGIQAAAKSTNEGARHFLMRRAAQMTNANVSNPTASKFLQGAGDAMFHVAQSHPVRALANPIGTAAEVGVASAGKMMSGALAKGGQALAGRAADQALVGVPGAALKQRVGSMAARTFAPGGTGHTALTKWAPAAAEIAGPVALGGLTHLPTGLAGIMGGAALNTAGATIGAVAPHVAEAAHHAVSPLLHHAVSDVVGTKLQGLAARGLTGGAAGHHG